MRNQTPEISTAYDFDSEEYFLTVFSHGFTAPAGPRVFRHQPYPDIQFRHTSETAALADAEKLRAYLATIKK